MQYLFTRKFQTVALFDEGLDDDDLVNNNRSRPLLPDRPVHPVGARQPLNWNVRPNSPEGRTPYEGATGIKPNETKRNEKKRNVKVRTLMTSSIKR